MIEIIKDIDLFNDINKYDYILIGTNCFFNLPNGFGKKADKYYPYIGILDSLTPYGNKKKLGTFIECVYKNNPKFLLGYICFGYNFRPDLNSVYIDYDALTSIIKQINIIYKGKKIATTCIGCSKYDGNGDFNKVRKILEENSTNINLYIYDYFIKDNKTEYIEQKALIKATLATNYNQGLEMIKNLRKQNKELKKFTEEIKKKYFK